MPITTILLIVILIVLIGSLPTWGHSASWGYGPSSIAAVALVVVLVLILTGRL